MHLQAHAWNGKEKRQLSHPQTNLWKSDSASPDDVKSLQKKETFLWSAQSTSVGPNTRRPTATPARAGYPLTPLVTRNARTSSGSSRQKRQPQQASQSPQKVAAPAADEAGHAIPPDAAAEAVTPAKTPGAPREEEPDKLMKNLASSCKNRRESGNGRPSRTGGTPAAAPGHRRLRDKRLHTLLRPTSGQPSSFHGPQAGRRSR